MTKALERKYKALRPNALLNILAEATCAFALDSDVVVAITVRLLQTALLPKCTIAEKVDQQVNRLTLREKVISTVGLQQCWRR